MQEITIKYHSNHRNHRYELADVQKKQSNKSFVDKKLAIKVIIDCRAIATHKFNTRLGFKQFDVTLTKGHKVLPKIKSSFEVKNTQTQNNILSYKID